jgi:hypothetical protein
MPFASVGYGDQYILRSRGCQWNGLAYVESYCVRTKGLRTVGKADWRRMTYPRGAVHSGVGNIVW